MTYNEMIELVATSIRESREVPDEKWRAKYIIERIKFVGLAIVPEEATDKMDDVVEDLVIHMGGGSIERPEYREAYSLMIAAGRVDKERSYDAK